MEEAPPRVIVRLNGLHHVTAITGCARQNRAFYAGLLGLRMLAVASSWEDAAFRQLIYGDELGRPGSRIHFLECAGAVPGRAGAGMAHRILWRVMSEGALDFWRARLAGADVDVDECGQGAIRFEDREGLGHELVVDRSGDEPLAAQNPAIPAQYALRGLDGVRAYASTPCSGLTMLENVLGAARQAPGRWELRGKTRGGWLTLGEAPSVRPRRCAGTVHHVGWSTTPEQQARMLGELCDAGVPSSGVVDRRFSRSLYIEGPGGLLFDLTSECRGSRRGSQNGQARRRTLSIAPAGR